MASVFISVLMGCSSVISPSPKNLTYSKVEEVKQNSQTFSKWYEGREERVPLTITAVAYINPKLKMTPEYKYYKNLVEILKKEQKESSNVLGFRLNEKFSDIQVVDFESSQVESQKFNAMYLNRFSSKDVLTDILRPDKEHSSAQILLRVNYKKLQDGVLALEGYKSIKTSNKKRNSYYFEIIRTNYGNLSLKKKKEAIIDSLSAALRLSIPDYISIDRKNISNDKKQFSIVREYETGKYEATIYRPKQVDKYNSIDTKEVVYISPITQEDMEILYKTNYLPFKKTDDFSMKEIRTICQTFDREFLDSKLVAAFPKVFENVGSATVIDDTLIVHKKESYSLDNLLTSSKEEYDTVVYSTFYKNGNFIENDIDNGFIFPLLKYISDYDDLKSIKYSNVYLQFKKDRLYKILPNKVAPKDALNLLDTQGIETVFYEKNSTITDAYGLRGAWCWGIFFVTVNGGACQSDFYKTYVSTLPIVVSAMWMIISAGIVSGSHIVVFDKESINDTNFRALELFKSEL